MKFIIGNFVLLFSLLLFILKFIFGGITGVWGKGPFITDLMYYGILSIFTIIIIVLYNWALLVGLNRVRGVFLKWFSRNKRYVKVAVPIVTIFLLFNANLIVGYVVSPYSREELSDITWSDWNEMSSREKLWIGQAYYWEYKNHNDGFYRASEYVDLIESFHTKYDYVDQSVFLYFCRC